MTRTPHARRAVTGRRQADLTLSRRITGFAFLGIHVERYTDDDGPHWIVTRVFQHLVGDANLVPGAEITHWNGTPMGTAVDRNADRVGGSNQAARRARGLATMTLPAGSSSGSRRC